MFGSSRKDSSAMLYTVSGSSTLVIIPLKANARLPILSRPGLNNASVTGSPTKHSYATEETAVPNTIRAVGLVSESPASMAI